MVQESVKMGEMDEILSPRVLAWALASFLSKVCRKDELYRVAQLCPDESAWLPNVGFEPLFFNRWPERWISQTVRMISTVQNQATP